MIISKMDGGLGNQLFQYALGLSTARRTDGQLLLDLRSYQNQPEHGYLLNRFNVDAPVADRELLQRLPKSSLQGPIETINGLFANRKIRRLKEKPFGFHERYMISSGNRYLIG